MLLLIGAIGIMWPLVIRFNTAVPANNLDPVFITWLLRRNWFMLTHDPLHLFDAGIFYPVANTLAMSDLALVQTLIYGFFFTLSGATVASANAVVLVSIVCSGLAMATLAQHWTGNRPASVASGLAYAFSPIVLSYAGVGHPQLLVGWWLPLAVLSADQLATRYRYRDGILLAVFLWLQFLSAVYLAFYAVLAVGGTLVIRLAVSGWRPLRQRNFLLATAVSAVLLFALVTPFSWPFEQVSREWDVARTLDDTTVFSADAKSFLAGQGYDLLPAPFSGYQAKEAPIEKYLWPGWGVLLLAGVATGWQVRALKKRTSTSLREPVLIGAYVAITGMILALGPYLHVWGRATRLPLPYLLLYRFMPGFNSMRVSARFSLLMAAGLAILVGCGITVISQYGRNSGHPNHVGRGLSELWAQRVSWIVVVLLGLSVLRRPIAASDLSTLRESELAPMLAIPQQGALLWLPLIGAKGEPDPWREVGRMFLNQGQTPMVGGHSGWFPPTVLELDELLKNNAVADAAAVLEGLDIRTIILDIGRDGGVPEAKQKEWAALVASGQAQSLGRSSDHLALLLPKASASPAQAQWELGSLAAPAGTHTLLGVRLLNTSPVPWTAPVPYDRTDVQVSWWSQDSGRVVASEHTSLRLPLYVLPNAEHAVPLPITVPALPPGNYDISVSGEGVDVSGETHVIAGSQPDSRTGDKSTLLARVSIADMSPVPLPSEDTALDGSLSLAPTQALKLVIDVANTGPARWLGGSSVLPSQSNGVVRLGWKWFVGSDPSLVTSPPLEEGRVLLEHDVYPEQSVRFPATVIAPAQPGNYLLEVDMLSEGRTWFHVSNPATSVSKRLLVTVAAPTAAAP